MKIFKAFIKPFEKPQRIVKKKKNNNKKVNFFSLTGTEREGLRWLVGLRKARFIENAE